MSDLHTNDAQDDVDYEDFTCVPSVMPDHECGQWQPLGEVVRRILDRMGINAGTA